MPPSSLGRVRRAAPARIARILLVEDHAGVRELVEEVLRAGGLDVVGVPDARTALDRRRTGGSFDLLLCDVDLPDMNGVALASELERAGDVPRVRFLSGSVDLDALARSSRRPPADFLAKPFLPDELLGFVRGALERGRRTRRRAR